LDRIAAADTVERRRDGIDVFDVFLCPWIDDDYAKALRGDLAEIANLESLSDSMKGKDERMANATSRLYNDKFKALMRLAKRQRFLGEDTVWAEDEDDTDYDADKSTGKSGDILPKELL